MKKLLLTGMMVLLLGACTGAQSEEPTKLSRNDTNSNWWEETGDPNGNNWWINSYETNMSE